MNIRVVHRVEVFDVVHSHYRQPHTLVSLNLDGRNYYSLRLPGTRTLTSGENVVVAFRDKNESQIQAWVDPVSTELMEVDGWSPFLFLIPGVVVAAGVAHALTYLGLSGFVAIAVSLVALVLALVVVLKHRAKLESSLKAYGQ